MNAQEFLQTLADDMEKFFDMNPTAAEMRWFFTEIIRSQTQKLAEARSPIALRMRRQAIAMYTAALNAIAEEDEG